jgi:membrane protein
MGIKQIWRLLQQTFQEWSEDKASRLAAALAYYTVFSLAPLLVIVVAIAGTFFGQDEARDAMLNQIQGLVGADGASFVESALENTNQQEGAGLIASIISVGILLFGASGVFAELQDSLNTVWNVTAKPEQGPKGFIRKRILSFSMVFAIGFLLMVSLAVSALLAGLSAYLNGLFPALTGLLNLLNFVISLGVLTLLFAMLYKYVPDVKITWRDVGIGALITALLFNIGKSLIGLYLGNSTFASAYGAAGSVIIVLAWVYYSAQILFFGAEFTQVYASRYGSRIVPDEHAMPMSDEARARQGLPPSQTANLKNQHRPRFRR